MSGSKSIYAGWLAAPLPNSDCRQDHRWKSRLLLGRQRESRNVAQRFEGILSRPPRR